MNVHQVAISIIKWRKRASEHVLWLKSSPRPKMSVHMECVFVWCQDDLVANSFWLEGKKFTFAVSSHSEWIFIKHVIYCRELETEWKRQHQCLLLVLLLLLLLSSAKAAEAAVPTILATTSNFSVASFDGWWRSRSKEHCTFTIHVYAVWLCIFPIPHPLSLIFHSLMLAS